MRGGVRPGCISAALVPAEVQLEFKRSGVAGARRPGDSGPKPIPRSHPVPTQRWRPAKSCPPSRPPSRPPKPRRRRKPQRRRKLQQKRGLPAVGLAKEGHKRHKRVQSSAGAVRGVHRRRGPAGREPFGQCSNRGVSACEAVDPASTRGLSSEPSPPNAPALASAAPMGATSTSATPSTPCAFCGHPPAPPFSGLIPFDPRAVRRNLTRNDHLYLEQGPDRPACGDPPAGWDCPRRKLRHRTARSWRLPAYPSDAPGQCGAGGLAAGLSGEGVLHADTV